MNTRDREPLAPDERDLAQRLSRLDGQAAPSPALDAAILAAARAAVQPRSRRARPRWPLGVGIAASLAVAMGIAWQLRPMPDTALVTVPTEADASASRSEAATAAAASSQDAPRRVVAPQAAIPTDAGAPGQDAPRAETAPAAVRQARATAAEPPREDAPAEPMLLDVAPPSSPPPPAPPAPPAPAAAPAPPVPAPAAAAAADAEAKVRAQEAERRMARGDQAASMRAAEARPEAAPETLTVTGSRIRQTQPVNADRIDDFLDEPLDDRPPVSFATAEARDAWLGRIRELVAEGDRAAARASLLEFRRRYPQHPVPTDLKPLLAE